MDYSPQVVRRFGSPLRAGKFVEGPAGLVVGEAEDRSLNVWVRFQVQSGEGWIEAVRFQVFGCPHTVAAASWAAEWLEGKAIDALRQLDVQELARYLSIPLEKMGKLLRVEDALLACWRECEDGTKR